MKKGILILACAIMCSQLVACSSDGGNDGSENSSTQFSTTSEVQYVQSSDIEDTLSNTSNETSNLNQQQKPSDVEVAYKDACSLTIYDLDTKIDRFTKQTNYYYKDVIIQSEDVEWLTASWNTEKSLNQGAIYRTIAKYLEGFSAGFNNGSGYAELLCGIKWKSKDDFAPYAENASEFICRQDSLNQIMMKLETLKAVKGNFDYENKKFHVKISDVEKCAKEMKISEQMFGYVLAELDEYGYRSEFEGNSCTIDFSIDF